MSFEQSLARNLITAARVNKRRGLQENVTFSRTCADLTELQIEIYKLGFKCLPLANAGGFIVERRAR